ncbi:hypothetical protein QJR52_15620 (plasmid) [Clostridium baratii]|uniref:hypothetical protein n=1 Tax=Clostridium baratii TaxID=1561 RepID=UPI0030CC82AC
MSKILSEKQINLLIKSTVCDKDVELKAVLAKFNKGIDTIQLEEIKNENENVFYKLNSKEIIKSMIDGSSKEWIQEKPIGIVEKPCELCKNPLSKDKFIIRNRLNKNELLVGTSCIEKFIKIEKPIKGEKLSELIKLSGDRSETYERLAAFNKMYKGGKTIIDGWENFYNNFDIVFPIDIENKWNSLNKGAKKFYKDYKIGKIPEEDLYKFKYYRIDFNNLKNDILKFYDKNKDNKFICTKKIEEELKKEDLNNTLNDIKSGGSVLKEWHIKYIGDTDFIRQFNKEISDFMNINDVNILKIEDRKIVGEIIKFGFDNLKIELSTKKFTSKFFDVISKQNIYKSKDLLLYSDIFKNRNNIFKFIDIIAGMIRKYKYYIEIDDEMYESGFFEVYKDKKFARIEIKKILEDKNLFMDKIKFKDIKEYMDKLEWKDKKDKEKYDIGNVGKVRGGGSFI